MSSITQKIRGELIPHLSAVGPHGSMTIDGSSIVGEFVTAAHHASALADKDREIEGLKAQLAEMTADRNLWKDAHNEDCPNKAELAKHLVETLIKIQRVDFEQQNHCCPWCRRWPHREGCIVDAALTAYRSKYGEEERGQG